MRFRKLVIRTVVALLVLGSGWVAPAWAEDAAKTPRKPITGILYNEDDSNRFGFDAPGKMTPARLDALVDELADSQVSIMLICCCAKKTNFDSKSWEPHCTGFDPSKGNDQSYFGDTTPEARVWLRKWADNLRVLLEAGVCPTGRMIERCRQRGISPWVSVRMNDAHDAPLARSPLHSKFYMEHPEYRRYTDRLNSWHDRCLNYGLEPVRAYVMSLIKEVCDRFDMDGLELDWNRFCGHFREGEEIAKGKELTEWMVEVRKVVRAAERKWKHPITLAARVPGRPEVSMGNGLEAVIWAQRGLIDHLIVAPFFSSTDYDMPVDKWNELLAGTGVGVTAGLEGNVRCSPGGPRLHNLPERRRGAAMAYLARGSQGIYVFNYFNVGREMPYLLKEMGSIATLKGKDRTYTVTYCDIPLSNKPLPAPLPRKVRPGESAEFRLYIGPKPIEGARGEIHVGHASDEKGKPSAVKIAVNDRPTQPTDKPELFRFDREAFKDGYNMVRVANTGPTGVTVNCVELSVRFGGQ
ncbi:MAG: hypothetical protein JXQ73_02535 [Phycisphaerae bacterium]|nr:hypothetical protein [Phycisphaerae bacterium]